MKINLAYFPNALSNFVYTNKKIVVKRNFSNTDILNRQNQELIESELRKISHENIVLPFRSYFKNKQYTQITKYIKNTKPILDIKITAKIFQKIIDTIKDIQKIKTNGDIIKFPYKELLIKFTNKKKFPSKITQLIDKYYKNNNENVLSQNDLVSGNILVAKNKLYIIDFEMSALNHYLFDFASFISETLILKPKLINKFIKIANFSKNELIEINELIILQDYLWMNWANYFYNLTNKIIYQEIYNHKKENYENNWFKKYR
ncbi:hypothetical protein [Spiroplasma endosymbiont of Labia minor]|uniref:hypothetical protein n=1 Tax=Spiroplasma endosymbiont of Labia minor TaxID=3066305 RepID=UPI0030D58425